MTCSGAMSADLSATLRPVILCPVRLCPRSGRWRQRQRHYRDRCCDRQDRLAI